MLDVPVVSPILFQLCKLQHGTGRIDKVSRTGSGQMTTTKLIALAPGQTVMTP
jgi:hypothetical protein